MIITTLMWVEALWHMDPKVEQKNPTKTHITRYGLMALGAGWTVAHYVLSFILVFQLFFGVLIVSALLLMYNEYQRVCCCVFFFFSLSHSVCFSLSLFRWGLLLVSSHLSMQDSLSLSLSFFVSLASPSSFVSLHSHPLSSRSVTTSVRER